MNCLVILFALVAVSYATPVSESCDSSSETTGLRGFAKLMSNTAEKKKQEVATDMKVAAGNVAEKAEDFSNDVKGFGKAARSKMESWADLIDSDTEESNCNAEEETNEEESSNEESQETDDATDTTKDADCQNTRGKHWRQRRRRWHLGKRDFNRKS